MLRGTPRDNQHFIAVSCLNAMQSTQRIVFIVQRYDQWKQLKNVEFINIESSSEPGQDFC